jgi:hypothetical protein
LPTALSGGLLDGMIARGSFRLRLWWPLVVGAIAVACGGDTTDGGTASLTGGTGGTATGGVWTTDIAGWTATGGTAPSGGAASGDGGASGSAASGGAAGAAACWGNIWDQLPPCALVFGCAPDSAIAECAQTGACTFKFSTPITFPALEVFVDCALVATDWTLGDDRQTLSLTGPACEQARASGMSRVVVELQAACII